MQAPEVNVRLVQGKYNTEFAVKVIVSVIRSAESSIFPVIAAMTESSVNWMAVKPSVPFVLAPVPLA